MSLSTISPTSVPTPGGDVVTPELESPAGIVGFVESNPWITRFGPYLSLLGLILVAVVLPARERSTAPSFDASAPLEISQPVADDLGDTTLTVPAEDVDVAAPTFEASSPPAFDGGTNFGGDTSVDTPAPSAPMPGDDGGFVAPAPPPAENDESLTIDTTAYSTFTGPTGFTEPEFKELRASTALGQDRERSFVRFAGGPADVVTFAVDAEETVAADIAELQLCVVTTKAWTSKNTTFDAGPQHDAERCAVGTPAEDFSSWTFDLSDLGGTAPPDGFALVPVGGGIGTWSVTFLGLAS